MIEQFVTNDGLELQCQHDSSDNAVATLVLVHGVGEHMQRYNHTADFFSERGYACWSYDQRGFGSSSGKRGHVATFAEYADDLEKFVTMIKNENADKPLFVLGHSMGSLVVLLYAIRGRSELSGLLSMSTPLITPSLPMRMAMPLVAMFSGLAPNLSLTNHVDAELLSHDADVVQDYQSDPLNVRSVTASWIRGILDARKKILKEASRIRVPVFIAHGTGDQIAGPESAQLLAERLRPELTTVRLFDELKHELLNEIEPERTKVQEEVLSWLEKIRTGDNNNE